MTLPPSASEESSSFALLDERVRRWIWNQHWSELRDVQEQAIRAILKDDGDVIITAATAAGKTEAAFLPICSVVIGTSHSEPVVSSSNAEPKGVQVLYVGPLKALINDQWRRLDGLCDTLDIPVHRWHGDVNESARRKLLTGPDGVLLITPESLEALFVRRGTEIERIFGALKFVVIDELHAFIGSERGMQLQSLLHRLERVLHRSVRRVGLSATLGDLEIAADFLRPTAHRLGRSIVNSSESATSIKLKLYGFKRSATDDEQPAPDVDDDETARSIAEHLFKNLRGSNNLVFANSRSAVEMHADLLSRLCAGANLPQEFFAHHGSLSRDLRFDVEHELKRGDRPLTVVCTSTLEMGIDIGAVKSVAQIGPPPNVASLRQRLGRSGRRGDPAILRLYVEEKEVRGGSSIQDAIRSDLVQTIAMVNLLVAKWIEPPSAATLHGSTLVQQVLSVIAQYGGITAADCHKLLCESGPFRHVSPRMLAGLLRNLALHDLVAQMTDGLLIHGGEGERAINHYDFYAAFTSSEEYRIVSSGKQLGTLSVVNSLVEGSFLIFAGRRWCVTALDSHMRVIDVVPAAGGRVPAFHSSGRAVVHDRVRQEMLAVYMSDAIPTYLDKAAAELLAEGRGNFVRFGLDHSNYVASGDGALFFPWVGTIAMNTVACQLAARGMRVSIEGPALVAAGHTLASLHDAIHDCEAERPIDVIALAASVANKEEEKWDWALDDNTLAASYAGRMLDANPARAISLPGGWVGSVAP